jgi:hypothetical protein
VNCVTHPRTRRHFSRQGFRLAALAAATALIVACGGGGGDEAPSAAGPPSGGGGNQPPTISGAPQTSVMQNTPYSFKPTYADPNGDALTFSIQNKPGWATFNASTGELAGTPSSSDVASYGNIQISVSDGKVSANLAAFSINVVAMASGAATLTWTPPTQNVDGTSLTDLAGYRIYWGTSQNNLTNSTTVAGAGVSSALIEQLTPATYYFAVTAYDTVGNESAYSNVATKTVL